MLVVSPNALLDDGQLDFMCLTGTAVHQVGQQYICKHTLAVVNHNAWISIPWGLDRWLGASLLCSINSSSCVCLCWHWSQVTRMVGEVVRKGPWQARGAEVLLRTPWLEVGGSKPGVCMDVMCVCVTVL